MKIIAIGHNYLEQNRELDSDNPAEPVVFLKPDTALLLHNRPFYIPDFTDDLHYETELLVRINRLGKHIAPLDGSAVVSEFIQLERAGGDIGHIRFRLDLNGRTVQQGDTADMIFPVDELIAYVSRFFTLKMGDILFTGTPAGVGRVAIGDRLEGYIGEEKMFDFQVR